MLCHVRISNVYVDESIFEFVIHLHENKHFMVSFVQISGVWKETSKSSQWLSRVSRTDATCELALDVQDFDALISVKTEDLLRLSYKE